MKLQAQKTIDSWIGGPLLILLKPFVILAGLILRRNHRLPDAKIETGRITVMKMLGGGSLVIALPALLGIRTRYPRAKIQLVTTTGIATFARTLGVFDEILEINTNSAFKLIWTSLRALVRSFRSDCFLDLEVYSKLSTVFSLFTCARNRIGFYLENVVWRKPIQTHLIFFNRFAPAHLFYERMAALVCGQTFKPASYEACRQSVLRACKIERAKNSEHTIAIGAGCSSLGQERMFSAEEWISIFQARLQKEPTLKQARFVFLGAEEDAVIAKKIIELLATKLQIHSTENYCGRLKLRDSLEELYAAQEFWGIDSSLLHYARLFGLKCVSFWGPTDPKTRLKAFPITEEVLYRKTPCSPCVHVAELPPCNGNNVCMKSLISPRTDAELEETLPVIGNI